VRVAPEPGSAFKKAWAAVSDHPIIREAVSEDNSFLAAIILRSARSHQKRGIWDLVFPDSEDDLLRLLETLAVQEPECSCHFSNFLVAESSGEPGAGLSGYDPASVSGVGQALAFAFENLGVDEKRLMAAFQRLALFQCCAPDQTPGVWIVEWVATQPEFRRRGFADLLLREILERGKERGYSTAQISTFVENRNAIKAYKAPRSHPSSTRAPVRRGRRWFRSGLGPVMVFSFGSSFRSSFSVEVGSEGGSDVVGAWSNARDDWRHRAGVPRGRGW